MISSRIISPGWGVLHSHGLFLLMIILKIQSAELAFFRVSLTKFIQA